MMVTATKKKPARKLRQKPLPKMGQVKNEKIERLAEKYVAAREEWMGMKQPFIDARDLLEIAMKEAGITSYEFDGKVCEFDGPTPHVKVRNKKSDPDEE